MCKSRAWLDFIISTSHVTKKTVNYGKVIDSLSKKQHEWNIELFFYQGIVWKEMIELAINLWLIVFCLAVNLWLAAG